MLRYATRLNSFLRTGKTVPQALEEIGNIDGIDYVDINYPEHLAGITVEQLETCLEQNHLRLDAVNLRFRDEFLDGIFSNPSAAVREKAVKLCLEAADICRKLKGEQIIIWLGFDGYDYSFQCDYTQVWKHLVSCFREVCSHSQCRVSIEYKPYEERTFAVLDSWGAARQMVEDVNCINLGITLDFCHMLMKKENPAFAASLLLNEGKLFGVHLNDGEGSADDGLMVGAVNLWKLVELYYYLKRYDYRGIIYFDTFPKREAAALEARANMAMCRKVESIISRSGLEKISQVISQRNSVSVMEMFCDFI